MLGVRYGVDIERGKIFMKVTTALPLMLKLSNFKMKNEVNTSSK